MYLDFFKFSKHPFHITPDPEFLFLSPSHKEAFDSISHAVEQRKGFIAVTGEVGTGKTTILRSYVEGTWPDPSCFRLHRKQRLLRGVLDGPVVAGHSTLIPRPGCPGSLPSQGSHRAGLAQ